MDRIIEVKINGNYLTKDNNLGGVQGEANVTALRIEFDAGWDGFAKTVTFLDALGQNPVKRTLTADLLEDITKSTRIYLCLIPGEPLRECGWCSFVIDGYADGKRQRSLEENLLVKSASVTDSAAEPVDPTPTQAEQLQKQIDTVLGDMQEQAVIAHDAATAAANSALSASDSATFAGESAYSAAASERAALEASEAAAASSKNAEGSAREAESSRIAASDSRDGAEAAARDANAAADLAEDRAAKTKTYRDEAQNAADSAYGSKVAAAESASAAASSANTAKNSANTATNSATSASGSAVSARNSATSAAASAKEAQRAADNAAGEAVDGVEGRLSGYVTDAETARGGAEAAQRAAEKARDEAQAISGGDFATTSYVDNKVDDITDSVEERLSNLTEADISHGSTDHWENALPPFTGIRVNRSRANRFALMPADKILVERSTDAGATWVEDTDFADADKVNLLTNAVANDTLRIMDNLSANERLRITLIAPSNSRTRINQIYTDISTRGHGVRVDIEGARNSDPNTFSILGNNVRLGGWNGPNVINIPEITWGPSSSSDYGKIRITYKISAVSSSQTGNAIVLAIKGYGPYAFYMHSNLAFDDCLYEVNHNGDATFPANLTAKTIADVTPTEIGYLSGVTGNVQEQLDSRFSLAAGRDIAAGTDLDNLRTPRNYQCKTNAIAESLVHSPVSTAFTMKVFYGNGTSNYVWQEINDNATGTTYKRRRDSTGGGTDWIATYTTTNKPKLSTFGITATAAELNYVDGVTSAIQTQLDGKAPYGLISASYGGGISSNDLINSKLDAAISTMSDGEVKKVKITGNTDTFLEGRAGSFEIFRISADYCIVKAYAITNTAGGSEMDYSNSKYNGTWQEWTRNYSTGYKPKLTDLGITATADELNYMSGAIGPIQAQLDGKQKMITGGATTIVNSDLAPKSVLVSNALGKVSASSVTSVELGFLDGVTSSIQTQLDAITEALDSFDVEAMTEETIRAICT